MNKCDLCGMTVEIVPKPLMCDIVGFEQKRRHRKKRINKKWAKRYGTKPVYSPEREAYIYDNRLLVGPDTWKLIKNDFEKAGRRE